MTVFNTNDKNENQKLFFGDELAISRYDIQKYPFLEKLTRQHIGFFWVPEEVELLKDIKDFKSLTDHEQHIFTSNLKRQILLDSVQGRGPSLAFLPIATLPELENFILTWSFFESIHSRSYTHIIRNVYSQPSIVFDGIMDIKEIVDCAEDISKYYDDLIDDINWLKSLPSPDYDDILPLKKKLWLALNAVNALEGIRFYVSFACSWAFAEVKKMEGNAKIIKLIARDENIHLAATQQLIKVLPKDDPDFEKIKKECEQQVKDIFQSVINQEKQWAEYLFKDGSMIGLNKQLLCSYVDYIAERRMTSIGVSLEGHGFPKSNPLSWTKKWIGGAEVQDAPQEVILSNYLIAAVKKDVESNTFTDFKL